MGLSLVVEVVLSSVSKLSLIEVGSESDGRQVTVKLVIEASLGER